MFVAHKPAPPGWLFDYNETSEVYTDFRDFRSLEFFDYVKISLLQHVLDPYNILAIFSSLASGCTKVRLTGKKEDRKNKKNEPG